MSRPIIILHTDLQCGISFFIDVYKYATPTTVINFLNHVYLFNLYPDAVLMKKLIANTTVSVNEVLVALVRGIISEENNCEDRKRQKRGLRNH